MNALFLAVVLMVCIYSIDSTIILRAKRSDTNKLHATDVLKGDRGKNVLTRTHDGNDDEDSPPFKKLDVETLNEESDLDNDSPKNLDRPGPPYAVGNGMSITENKPANKEKIGIKNEFEHDKSPKYTLKKDGSGNIYISDCTVVINAETLMKK